MAAAVAVQMKGSAFLLFSRMYASMARISEGTLTNVPRRIRLRVISANQRSTRLSHEELVETK